MSFHYQVTHVEVKPPYGRLISGDLISGTLAVNAPIYFYDSNNNLIAQSTIETIYNDGIQQTTFDHTQTARRLKLTIALDTTDILPGQFAVEEKQTNTFSSFGEIGFGVLDTGPLGTLVTATIDDQPLWNSFLNSGIIWRGRTDVPLNLTLQGGGAKGAFGVGALYFLEQSNILTRTRQLKLASASTGSLTTILLAENGATSIEKAIDQYTNLMQLEDMFTLRPEVLTLMQNERLIKELVVAALRAGGVPELEFELSELLMDKIKRSFKQVLSPGPHWGLMLTGLGPGILLGAATHLVHEFANIIPNVTKFAKVKKSLATLDPIVQKLRDPQVGVEQQRLYDQTEQNRVTIRMAVTSMNSGATCYVTENLELMYPRKGDLGDGYNYLDFHRYKIRRIGPVFLNDDTSPLVRKEGLIHAAITSGAFPAFFEPQEIEFEREVTGGSFELVTELFSDGGIRENMPIDLHLQEGAKQVLAIYCSPVPESEVVDEDIANYSWIDVLSRATELIDEENGRADVAVGQAINTVMHGSGNQPILHIAPTVPTIGLTEIDPGHIQSTIWYGYLRAYDEVFLSEFKQALGAQFVETRKALRINSEEIYICWRALRTAAQRIIGTSAYRTPAPGGGFMYKTWDGESLAKIRLDRYNFGISLSGSHPELENGDDILYIAFREKEFYTYLELKYQLIHLFNVRLNLIDLDPNKAQSFWYGERGFMRKAMFTDWYGVYQALDHMKLAENKRARLVIKFMDNRLFAQGADPLRIKSDAIYDLHNPEAPGRMSETSGPYKDFQSQLSRIRTRMAEFEAVLPLEGQESDQLTYGRVILVGKDHSYAPKDQSIFRS